MDSQPTVLSAGITGTLGSKIALALLDKGVTNVKGLVRSNGISDRKQQQLDALNQVRAAVNLNDRPSHKRVGHQKYCCMPNILRLTDSPCRNSFG